MMAAVVSTFARSTALRCCSFRYFRSTAPRTSGFRSSAKSSIGPCSACASSWTSVCSRTCICSLSQLGRTVSLANRYSSATPVSIDASVLPGVLRHSMISSPHQPGRTKSHLSSSASSERRTSAGMGSSQVRIIPAATRSSARCG